MVQRISTHVFGQRLGDILNRVFLRHDEYIVERKGKPLAAVVPVEKLERIERLARLHVLDALANRKTAPLQAEADELANEAKHRSRKPRKR